MNVIIMDQYNAYFLRCLLCACAITYVKTHTKKRERKQ